MTNGHSINYELLAKEALRSVVKTVLQNALKDGLPGEHHFYISFHTTAPGVKISSRIAAQYPKEMTIVLQHQYWDLRVEDEHFEVRLSFSNIPELLVVPYSAIKVFFDPSVPYGLQFDQSARPEAVEDKSGFMEDSWQIPTENGLQDISDLNNISNFDQKDHMAPNAEAPIELATAKLAEFTPSDIDIEDDPDLQSDDSTSTDGSQNDETSINESSDKDADGTASDTEDDKDSADILSLDAFRKK